MDDNLAIFLVMTIAIGAAVALTVLTAWIRSGKRLAVGDAEQVALLTNENKMLTREVSLLEERLRVLERIATDPAERMAHEIERLR